ncbi:PilZ domain-containing protein [Acidobacteriota bacterium]
MFNIMTKKKKRNLRIAGASEKNVHAWKERREKRFKEENKVVIEWNKHMDPKTNGKIYAFTQDLSVGGTKILTNINFPLNTTFTTTLTLSRSKQNIRVSAKVKFVNPVIGQDLYEVGLEFIHDFPQTVSSLFRHLYGHTQSSKIPLESAEEQNRIIYL